MTKKALLIGINYNGTAAQLNGCINDVYNVRSLLTNHCDYPSENINTLTDNDISPTHANIRQYISWLLQNAQPGDTLFFHYSGHGSNVADNNGDETDKRDETIVPVDYNSAGMITDDWLNENFINLVPEGVTLWILMDCCHSGTIMDLKYNYRSLCRLRAGKKITQPYASLNWTNTFGMSLQRTRDTKGNVYMFSGALDPQYAADAFIAGKAQGAFTACFIECFNTNLVQNDSGKMCFKPNGLNFRSMLKEINARLLISGYTGQNSQLSMGKRVGLEAFFNP